MGSFFIAGRSKLLGICRSGGKMHQSLFFNTVKFTFGQNAVRLEKQFQFDYDRSKKKLVRVKHIIS